MNQTMGMKTKIAFAFAFALLLSILFINPSLAKNEHKITLCHATASATNPYVKITVDVHAREAHLTSNGGLDSQYHGENNPLLGFIRDYEISPEDECDSILATPTPSPTSTASPTITATPSPSPTPSATPTESDSSSTLTPTTSPSPTPTTPAIHIPDTALTSLPAGNTPASSDERMIVLGLVILTFAFLFAFVSAAYKDGKKPF